MLRSSTFAGSSFSPERMLRSMTAPDRRFLKRVRVNAAPLPGLTNWNSTTVYGFPSINTFRPLRISDVSYMTRDVYPAPDGRVKPRFRQGFRRDERTWGRTSGRRDAVWQILRRTRPRWRS